jgi:hypothetical protein
MFPITKFSLTVFHKIVRRDGLLRLLWIRSPVWLTIP